MSKIRQTIWSALQSTFVRGLVVLMPVVLTIWFLQTLLNAIDGILSPVWVKWLGQDIPGLGFLSMMVLILLVGLVTRNLIGRIFFSWFEKLLSSIPVVRAIYGAIRDVINALSLGSSEKSFRHVVLFQYPRVGLYTLGFVTNELSYQASPEAPLMEFVSVYVPNPPNPTSGVLILVPRAEATPLNLTIEQGLKMVLSGAIVSPDLLTPRPA
ncbi:MAG TPA: DUF502 domain-containing protein [Bacteroidota bacterium]